MDLHVWYFLTRLILTAEAAEALSGASSKCSTPRHGPPTGAGLLASAVRRASRVCSPTVACGASSDVGMANSSSSSSSDSIDMHFSEFAVVGVRRAILRGEAAPQRWSQPVEALEVVLGTDVNTNNNNGDDDNSNTENRTGRCASPSMASPPSSAALRKISEFCFPQGGKLELAPAGQVELFTGRHRDQVQS